MDKEQTLPATADADATKEAIRLGFITEAELAGLSPKQIEALTAGIVKIHESETRSARANRETARWLWESKRPVSRRRIEEIIQHAEAFERGSRENPRRFADAVLEHYRTDGGWRDVLHYHYAFYTSFPPEQKIHAADDFVGRVQDRLYKLRDNKKSKLHQSLCLMRQNRTELSPSAVARLNQAFDTTIDRLKQFEAMLSSQPTPNQLEARRNA